VGRSLKKEKGRLKAGEKLCLTKESVFLSCTRGVRGDRDSRVPTPDLRYMALSKEKEVSFTKKNAREGRGTHPRVSALRGVSKEEGKCFGKGYKEARARGKSKRSVL